VRVGALLTVHVISILHLASLIMFAAYTLRPQKSIFHISKAYEIFYNNLWCLSLHFKYVAAQPWRIKNSNVAYCKSGRRTSRKGQLKGTSQQERVKNWYEHFQEHHQKSKMKMRTSLQY